VGLARGGAGVGTVVDLLPRTRRSATRARPRVNSRAVAAGVAAVVLFGGATYLQHDKVSSAKAKRTAAETEVQKLKNQIGRLVQAGTPTGAGANLQQEAATVLGTDVGWVRAVDALGGALPSGVWLTALQAQHTLAPAAVPAAPPPAAGAPAAAGSASNASSATGAAGAAPALPAPGAGTCQTYEQPIDGPVTLAGVATDVPTLAAFLDGLEAAGGDKPVLGDVWLANAQKASFGEADVVTFSVNATLGEGARSDRLRNYFKEALCK
jgi:Tfp pilus assembly protein PilN